MKKTNHRFWQTCVSLATTGAAIPHTRFPIRSLIVNATNYSFVLRVKSKYRNGTHSGKQTLNVKISNNIHNSYLFSHF
jgi:hypothetical protein